MSDSLDLNPKTERTENTSSESQAAKPLRNKRTWLQRLSRWGIRTISVLVSLPLLYILFAIILGSITVNTSFRQTPGGIEIAILNNGVHCDIAVPLQSAQFSWNEFLNSSASLSDLKPDEYALIGWGNRRFYIETRTWEDIKITNTLAALTGLGETVVHVDYVKQLPASSSNCRRIRISTDQYRQLCDSLQKSFRRKVDQQVLRIPGVSYRNSDAFYEGTGNYHLFNTCNVWSGRNLQAAGIRTGWWTPFSFSLFQSLPEEPEQTEPL